MTNSEDTTSPAPPAEPAPSAEGEPSAAPYRNLWVPLVVVPAAIVVVLVVIFALFGAIAGRESTPAENLAKMLGGGHNESRQACFNLVGQVLACWEDETAGRTPEWDLGADLLPALQTAMDRNPPEDPYQRFVLTGLLVQLGEPGALDRLLALIALPPADDADGSLRIGAIGALASIGHRLDAPSRERAAAALVALRGEADPGFERAVAIALQRLPCAAGSAALRDMLASGDFEVRANAALSLARLDDPGGAAVLREICRAAPYQEVHALDQDKFGDADLVTRSRVLALDGLARLALAEDRALFEDLSGDPVVAVREAALRALGALRGG